MANYTNLYGSTYPQNVLTQRTFYDLTDAQASLISKFQTLINNNDISGAQDFIELHQADLKDKFIDALVINWLFEEIRNAQIFAKQEQQFIRTGLISEVQVGDVWIGGE